MLPLAVFSKLVIVQLVLLAIMEGSLVEVQLVHLGIAETGTVHEGSLLVKAPTWTYLAMFGLFLWECFASRWLEPCFALRLNLRLLCIEDSPYS